MALRQGPGLRKGCHHAGVERPVAAGSAKTYPYPGGARMVDEDCYVTQDLALYDPAAGAAVSARTPGARLVPLTVTRYSDALLMFLLRGIRPEKFRERPPQLPPLEVLLAALPPDAADQVGVARAFDAGVDQFGKLAPLPASFHPACDAIVSATAVVL